MAICANHSIFKTKMNGNSSYIYRNSNIQSQSIFLCCITTIENKRNHNSRLDERINHPRQGREVLHQNKITSINEYAGKKSNEVKRKLMYTAHTRNHRMVKIPPPRENRPGTDNNIYLLTREQRSKCYLTIVQRMGII